MSRKKIIAGNWKMNMTPTEAVELVKTLKPLVAGDKADVVFCVPAIDIIPAMEAARGSNIHIGAENMYYEDTWSSAILREENTLQKLMRP